MSHGRCERCGWEGEIHPTVDNPQRRVCRYCFQRVEKDDPLARAVREKEESEPLGPLEGDLVPF